jgi:predicted branched-subunit amino acid permease
VFLFGATAIQYVTWQAGTIVGALGGNVLGDTHKLGLDAVYPAFFLALLIVEIRRPGGGRVALLGALIALALIPVAPAGVPVLAASFATFAGIRSRTA